LVSEATLPLAVQMYTLRNVPLPLDELFRRVAEIGYVGVETFMFGPPEVPAETFRAKLEKHDLKVISGAVALDMLENDFDEVIAYHKALGTDTLFVAWIPEERRPINLPGWVKLGRTLDNFGSRCAEIGMRLLYHNHEHELNLIDGKPILEWLLDTASPSHLGLELDLAWTIKAGVGVVSLLHKYAGRCPRVHLRDLIETDHGLEEGDVGDGILDWDALLPAVRACRCGMPDCGKRHSTCSPHQHSEKLSILKSETLIGQNRSLFSYT